MTKSLASLLLIILLLTCSNPQNQDEGKCRLVGGPCEGCEAIFEYGNKILSDVDTLPDFNEEGPRIKITGAIYQPDGKTPAKDVKVYIYHTNQEGVYETKGNESGWGKRHGYIRGWIKTNDDGKYTFYTLKPGTYPTQNAPAHIHATILEPNGKYYWIEEYLFDDDPLVSNEDKNKSSPRGGGSGILSLKKDGDNRIGVRDIVLGKNVPDYD